MNFAPFLCFFSSSAEALKQQPPNQRVCESGNLTHREEGRTCWSSPRAPLPKEVPILSCLGVLRKPPFTQLPFNNSEFITENSFYPEYLSKTISLRFLTIHLLNTMRTAGLNKMKTKKLKRDSWENELPIEDLEKFQHIFRTLDGQGHVQNCMHSQERPEKGLASHFG